MRTAPARLNEHLWDPINRVVSFLPCAMVEMGGDDCATFNAEHGRDAWCSECRVRRSVEQAARDLATAQGNDFAEGCWTLVGKVPATT